MRERGQSIVELALAVPILLIVLMGVMDLGRAYYVLVALEDMAAEGAIYAAINPDDVTGIQARAATASSGLVEVESSAVRFDCPTCAGGPAGGDSLTVTVPFSLMCTSALDCMPTLNQKPTATPRPAPDGSGRL